MRALERIAFKVHSLELLFISQLALDFVEVAKFAVAGPKLGEVGEAVEASEMLNGICANVDDVEVGVVFESGDLSEEVVRDVQFFEVDELVETGNGA